MTTCKNCGAEIDSTFCPHCGQKATAGERLTVKAFFKDASFNFARLNNGFLHTAKALLVQPWKVISDYINGKRVSYSPPVTMLIQVILYASVIVYIIEEITGIDLGFNDTPYVSLDVGHWFVDFVLSSDIFQNIIIILPAALGGMIAFRWVGGRKYNAAEYFVAATYMICLMFIAKFLVIPIQLFTGGFTYGVDQFFMVIITLATLWKAFPGSRWWKRILSILFYIVVAVALMALELALVIIAAVPFASDSSLTMDFNV